MEGWEVAITRMRSLVRSLTMKGRVWLPGSIAVGLRLKPSDVYAYCIAHLCRRWLSLNPHPILCNTLGRTKTGSAGSTPPLLLLPRSTVMWLVSHGQGAQQRFASPNATSSAPQTPPSTTCTAHTAPSPHVFSLAVAWHYLRRTIEHVMRRTRSGRLA